MHDRIGVPVSHDDIAVECRRGIGGMVEGRLEARPVPLPQRKKQLPIEVEAQDLVRVPIAQKHPIVRGDEDAVRVGELAACPMRRQTFRRTRK